MSKYDKEEERYWRSYGKAGKFELYLKYKEEAKSILKEIEFPKKKFEESLVQGGKKQAKKFFAYI